MTFKKKKITTDPDRNPDSSKSTSAGIRNPGKNLKGSCIPLSPPTLLLSRALENGAVQQREADGNGCHHRWGRADEKCRHFCIDHLPSAPSVWPPSNNQLTANQFTNSSQFPSIFFLSHSLSLSPSFQSLFFSSPSYLSLFHSLLCS